MRKTTLFLTALLCAVSLAGCSSAASKAPETSSADTAAERSEETAAEEADGSETTAEEADSSETTAEETDGSETAAEKTDGSENAENYPLTITIYDGSGNSYEETFEQAPERVVTTTTSAAELMIALGLEDRIVGIINPDNQVPEELQPVFDTFQNLGDKKTLSKEVIVSVEPDIVIGRVNNFTEETSIDSYSQLGILSYTQMAGNAAVSSSPEMILEDVKNLGMIFGVQDRAQEYAQELEARLHSVKDQIAENQDQTLLRSLFMVSLNDGVFGVMDGSLQDEIMAMVGCEDVADKGQSGLSYENLIQYNPDVIIYITADRNAASDSNAVESLLSEPLLQSVPAIANQRIMTVKYDCIMDVGPRMIDTIEEINEFLYKN